MATSWRETSHRGKRSWIIGIMLIVGTVLLFRGGPDYDAPRSFKHGWDIGHIIYFALVAWLLSGWRPIARQSPARQWAVILCITLIAGSLIELAQQSAALRNPDINDVLRDLTGAVLILSFGPACANIRSRQWKVLVQCAAAGMLLIQLWPLAVSLLDEAIARARFPVLADFETPFEIDRWRGAPGLSVASRPLAPAGKALKISLTTERYSGAGLFYFEGDWKGFHSLEMSVYNPGAEPLLVTFRVHDRQHTLQGHKYEDRFNRRVLLEAGWNQIEFDLNEVAAAPAHRGMDMGQIRGLGIFASALHEPRVIYLDNVRLQ
jgi:VanZ family protein